jgi:hypothetical protein
VAKWQEQKEQPQILRLALLAQDDNASKASSSYCTAGAAGEATALLIAAACGLCIGFGPDLFAPDLTEALAGALACGGVGVAG